MSGFSVNTAPVLYYFFINILLFALMFYDKRCAIKHKWRIKERTLMCAAVAGGAIGGFLAMFLFHHKNRKPIFYIVYGLGLVIHCGLIYLSYKGVIKNVIGI